MGLPCLPAVLVASLLGIFVTGFSGGSWLGSSPSSGSPSHPKAAVLWVSGSLLQVNKLILVLKEPLQHFFPSLLVLMRRGFPRDVIIIAKNVNSFLLSPLSFWNNKNNSGKDQELKKRGFDEEGLQLYLQEQAEGWREPCPQLLCFLAGCLER